MWNEPMEEDGVVAGREVRIALDVEADLVTRVNWRLSDSRAATAGPSYTSDTQRDREG